MERHTGSAYAVLGAVSAIGYAAAAWLVRSDNSIPDFLTFFGIFFGLSALWGITLWLASRSPPRFSTVLGFAVLFRVLLLPAGRLPATGEYGRLLLYDDDIWRYLWEGHAWAAGVNPMRTAPAALEEYELERRDPALHRRLYANGPWSGIFDNIGYREVPSPYPYGAQAVFRLAHAVAPGSVPGFKLLIVAFDVGNILLLARLARDFAAGGFAVLAYAWNPLMVKEFAGSAHIDAIVVFLMLAALCQAGRLGSLCLALGALVKPAPLLLVPALYKRVGWPALLAPAGAVALMLYTLPEGLKTYAAHWTFNPAFFRLLLPFQRSVALVAVATALAILAVYCYRKDNGSPDALIRHGLWVFGGLLLAAPMLAPWYLTWILPLAALRRAWFWLALSGSVFLSYHAYLEFAEIGWLALLEFAIPAAIWGWMRTRPGWGTT